jgi:hypothetical protein
MYLFFMLQTMALEQFHSQEVREQQHEHKESREKVERNDFLETEVKAKKLLKLGYPLENDVFKLREPDYPLERWLAVQLKNDDNRRTNTAKFKFNQFSNTPEQKGNMSAVDISEISQLVHSREADAFLNQKAVTPEQIEKDVQDLRLKEIYLRLTTLKGLEYFKGEDLRLERIWEKSIILKKKGQQDNQVLSLRQMGPGNYLYQKIDIDNTRGNATTTNLSPEEGLQLLEDIAFAPESTEFISKTLDDREQTLQKIEEENTRIDESNQKSFERIIWKLHSTGIDKYESDSWCEEWGRQGFKVRRKEWKLDIRPNKEYARKHKIFTIELSARQIDRLGYDGKRPWDNLENQERLSRVEQSLNKRISQNKQERENKEKKEADQNLDEELASLE